MYCTKCSAKLPKNAVFCSECGNNIKENLNKSNIVTNSSGEGSSLGWGILGFIIPLVGLILFIAWNKDRPKDSKAVGLGALIRVIVGIFLVIFTLFWFFLSGVAYYY